MSVTHRDMTEEEVNRQDLRLMQLDNALDEADMDEGSEPPEYMMETEGDRGGGEENIAKETGDSSDNQFSLSPSDDD